MGYSTLEYLYYHVFLPPRVPSWNDTESGRGDQALVEALIQVIPDFRAKCNLHSWEVWSTIQESLCSYARLHENNEALSRNTLKNELRNIERGGFIIMHIKAQNSGLVIRKEDLGYVVETFEASPQSADVLAAQGALEWAFPSRAVRIPPATYQNESFQDSLADFLEKASVESVNQFAATAVKAGVRISESRDTPSPAIIGHLLMAILEAVGSAHAVTSTCKRIRDEVCWSEGAKTPWRRSAAWLVVRVAIQRYLCAELGAAGGYHYKLFMIAFLESVCLKFLAHDSFPTDRLGYSRTKLARRMAKLDAVLDLAPVKEHAGLQTIRSQQNNSCLAILQKMGKRLEQDAMRIRDRNIKKVYRIPERAESGSLVLSLHWTGSMIERLTAETYHSQYRTTPEIGHRHARAAQYSRWAEKPMKDDLSTTDFFCLAHMENELARVAQEHANMDLDVNNLDRICVEISANMRMYQDRAYKAYVGDPEQRSLMLLVLLETWAALDTLLLKHYPLLAEYNPGLPKTLLYPLYAPGQSQMRRIQDLESYIKRRWQTARPSLPHLFGDLKPRRGVEPSKSFAVRFFAESEQMQNLLQNIKDRNDQKKGEKEEEFKNRSKEYDDIMREHAETTCIYTLDQSDPPKPKHDYDRCRKCFLRRRANRMNIEVYEDLLPNDKMEAKAIIFELLPPPGYTAWRDSTWQILQLARTLSEGSSHAEPTAMLLDDARLLKFASPRRAVIGLAAKTKMFTNSHYLMQHLPTNLQSVLLPHGQTYGLYDHEHRLWTAECNAGLSFANLCTQVLPAESTYSSLQMFLDPLPEGTPSFNDVIASQTRCPSSLSVVEYIGFQNLRLGTRLQWMTLLQELGSASINFGTIEVTYLVARIAYTAGPRNQNDALRASHWVFRNETFCQALLAQIEKRVEAVVTNWRESQTIECMLILLQRLWSLSSFREHIEAAERLLLYIRNLTHGWVRKLREEICKATDVETFQQRSRDTLHAALLCRKTFMLEAAEPDTVLLLRAVYIEQASVHPEPLTGRTGTDEALHCLRAGNAQPWKPLNSRAYDFLIYTADLTPIRSYYPEDNRVNQIVFWDETFTFTAQHDLYRPIVEEILSQCRLLRRFDPSSCAVPPYARKGDEHLLLRAKSRNQKYQPRQHESKCSPVPDSVYTPRDTETYRGMDNAYETAAHVRNWSSNIAVSDDLALILEKWPSIEGFHGEFGVRLLTEMISLDFASNWGSLFKLCQQSNGDDDKFPLMFLFATLAFNPDVNMTLLRSLVALAVSPDSSGLQLPQYPTFIGFKRDQVPTVANLCSLIEPHRVPYPADDFELLRSTSHIGKRRELVLAKRDYEKRSEESCKALANRLIAQWPNQELSVEDCLDLALLDVDGALLSVSPEWERLVNNFQLSEHLVLVQGLLDTYKNPNKFATTPASLTKHQCQGIPRTSYSQPYLRFTVAADDRLLENPATKSCAETREVTLGMAANQSISSTSPSFGHNAVRAELGHITGIFAHSEDPVRAAYGKDLESSLLALESLPLDQSQNILQNTTHFDVGEVDQMIDSFRDETERQFGVIKARILQDYPWEAAGGLLPDVTPITVLELIRESEQSVETKAARRTIVNYAESIVGLQQLLRIRDAQLRQDNTQLASEIQNMAHRGWKTVDHTDWLLLEVDSNILIREEQYEVAQTMLASSIDTLNFVLQMNMGKGKSSVIIPMVLTSLANGKNLARVVVPRSLLLQAAQTIQAHLGGLVGRTIRHIPYSRQSPTDAETIKAYHYLHQDTRQQRGAILTIPEHVLSFQLSGLQQLSNGNVKEARVMIKLQAWLISLARDVLDECDHMLAVKTQLIYPSGAQSPIDGHPHRWTITQSLLRLAMSQIAQLRRENPNGLEVIQRLSGTFPTVYLLNQEVKEKFMQRLTSSVLNGDNGILVSHDWSEDQYDQVQCFLSDARFSKATATKLAGLFKDDEDLRRRLLILRGLLFQKIILTCLDKRWNVQYGIHSQRDPVAVPFRSKGIPSDQAEFGHPDVSIALTCLSFYYSGLTLEQFKQSLEGLQKHDEPAKAYGLWIAEVGSVSVRSWKSINVDDEAQCVELWNLLRSQMSVVDFFLNHYVFPRHAKIFERKLTSSGWDIMIPPLAVKKSSSTDLVESTKLRSKATKALRPLSVGFSGTNDNKTLLPLNVSQTDLPGLSHINAEVLTYLLQKRNRCYIPASDSGRRLLEREFLQLLQRKGIRMLIDAGAQILEMDNLTLAQTWLEVEPHADAAVFFGEDERPYVVYKDGKQIPLAASPYLDNLEACLVYLDEAHTRGVDLKMPTNAVGALTLGMMQTKDQTVQAAMRLRQLATSQSVIFFAPPEVHQSILNARNVDRVGHIDSYDVVVWLLEQTCCSIEQLKPLYISQGLDYCGRRSAARTFEDAGYAKSQIQGYLNILEQPEKYSLEDLYAPDRQLDIMLVHTGNDPVIDNYVQQLGDIKKQIPSGDTVQALAHQESEQEREVAIEVETVRELKNPNHAKGFPQPPLHPDIETFVKTGRMVTGQNYFIQAFTALSRTALGRRLGVSRDATRSGLFVTTDFNTTITTGAGPPRDEYCRSMALIISDFEADALLPLLENQCPSIVYLISYSAPVKKSMVGFDQLTFFSLSKLPDEWRAPKWLVRDLGIFAGRTYFDYNDQYSAICEALGLSRPTSAYSDHDPTGKFTTCKQDPPQQPISSSPLLFMQEWLALRRKGQDFSQTMMGMLCQGRRLKEPDATATVGVEPVVEKIEEVKEGDRKTCLIG